MPPFHHLSATDVDALVALLNFAAGGAAPRAAEATPPPGPVVESGPAAERPGSGRSGGAGLIGAGSYPEGVNVPERLVMDGYGLHPEAISPPYTTLTAYDLNRGTIKWQIGLGDDPRLIAQGIRGTGAADLSVKGSVVVTSNGLLFVNAADQKVHIYEAASGKELHQLPLGAKSTGSPSMYEHNGRQYLLVTASNQGGRGGQLQGGVYPSGPTGLVAYALPR
jgi:quinoprotein glucose dehydrogenase